MIVAFVLVALNAGAPNTQQQTVVVATKDLLPRIPITGDALTTRSIPVPGTYPKVYFSRIEDVQGMIPLVTISKDEAVIANDEQWARRMAPVFPDVRWLYLGTP